MRRILVPDEIKVTVNDEELPHRCPVHAFEANLETEMADADGILRRRFRKTRVELFDPLPGEDPSLFELGLPVAEAESRCHINVGQKVPLTLSRDNRAPAFLRSVRVRVLNEMHGKLTEEDANSTWVQEATSDPDCSDEGITTFLDLRFGTNRASYDPSDPEANKAVQASGGVIVTGRMLNRRQWQNAREAAAIEPAGRVRPSAKPYSDDPNAPPVEVSPARPVVRRDPQRRPLCGLPGAGTDGSDTHRPRRPYRE